MTAGRNKPIRILHVLAGMNRGGIETWLMHVLRNIDRDRYQLDFLTSTTQSCAYDEEIRQMGSRIIPCLTPHNPLQYAKNFQRLVKENGPYDVLHSHIHHFSGFVCWLGKQAGIPMRIAHSHNDTTPKEAGAGLLRKTYLRAMKMMITRYATHGLACSGLAAEDLFGYDWQTDSRLRLLYYGIDLKPFAQAVSKEEVRGEFGFPPDAYILGHVGRFVEQKNHAFLIDIIKEVVEKNPKCHALLVGEGSLRPDIEAKVRRIGLEKHIVFAGVRPDIPRLMKGAMDAFVFPSLHEGLALVLVEAQAAGLNCFTSNRVPREAAVIGDAITFLGLDEAPGYWAEQIVAVRQEMNVCADKALAALQSSHFNITQSAFELCRFYRQGET